MKLLLALTFIFISHFTWSQKAIIRVIDSETKNAIPFVNVTFTNINTQQRIYSTTSLDGISHNICTSKSIITLSSVGYKTLIDTIKPLQELNYELVSDAFNLEQFTVTATRTEKHLKDAPIITQVITSQDIENRGLSTVQDVLTDDMPSVDFQQTGFGTNIQMQGLDAKYVLFLIDGERIAGETGGNIDYSRLNTANIERIEVVKGAASALYGSQAMGGVINIITKKTKKNVEVSLGSKYSQPNQKNYPDLKTNDPRFYFKQNLDRPNLISNLSVGLNIKKLTSRTDFVIKSFDAYKLYDTQEFKKEYTNIDSIGIIPKDSFSIDGYDDYSISQKFGYKVSNKLTIGIKGSYYSHNQYNFSTTGTYENNIDYTYGANINYLFSNNSSIVLSYYSDTYEKNINNEESQKMIKNEYKNQFSTPRIIYNSTYKKNKITTGAEFIDEKLASDQFDLQSSQLEERQSKTYVVFAQDDIDFTQKINFVFGARADLHSTYGFHITPKASAMYKAKKLTYRANYATGFRSPSLKELYMNWDHLGMFEIVGNEDLKPETNNYFSFATELITKRLNTSVTLYHNRFDNKIELTETNSELYEYTNFDYANISGMDVNAKYRILDDLSISGGYTYLLEDYSSKIVRVTAASPHSGNIRLEYKIRKGFYDAIINLNGKFYGAKNFTAGEDIIYNGEEIYAEFPINYTAYSMWKISITQRLFNSVNAVFIVDNLLNNTSNVVSYSSNLSPGRRFSIGLDINLDRLYQYIKSNH